MLTSAEVAAMLRLEPVTIRRWAARGKIRATKVSNQWRFERAYIERWIAMRTQPACGGF